MFRKLSRRWSQAQAPGLEKQSAPQSVAQQPELKQDGPGAWFRDPPSGMPYDYEYLSRLGWRPRFPGEQRYSLEREALGERSSPSAQGSASAFGSNSGRIPGDYGEPELDRPHAFKPRRAWGGYYGKGPKGYTRPDTRIYEEVCERLKNDHELDASEVSVGVRDGEVILEGNVSDWAAKRRAVELAECVSGVSCVTSKLCARRTKAFQPGARSR